MNYKGNAFSAGSGRVCDSVEKDGKIYFLQARGQGFELRAFDTAKNAFETVESGISLADSCWFFRGGLLELFGSRLTAALAENEILQTLS